MQDVVTMAPLPSDGIKEEEAILARLKLTLDLRRQMLKRGLVMEVDGSGTAKELPLAWLQKGVSGVDPPGDGGGAHLEE